MTPRAAGWINRLRAGVLIAFSTAASAVASDRAPHSAVVSQALALIDVPYRYGGSSPSGFDCSGLVRYVFRAAAGIELPRRTEDMSRVGQPIRAAELQPGDLVFFNTFRRAYSHVAIYVGDGRFLHAPARGGRVRIEALADRYWKSRFDGARRLLEGADGASGLESPTAAVPPFEVEPIRP